jgi:hypothetical protein
VAEVAFDGTVAAVASVEASLKKPAAAASSSSRLSSQFSHDADRQSATATATQETAATTTPPPSTSTVARRQRTKNRRGEVLPTATSRQKDKKTVTKIKKGVRVKLQHQVLYHLCSRAQQAKLPTNVGNSYNVYGTVMHGDSGQCGWDVQFDVLTKEYHTVKSLTRSKIDVVEKGGEELEYDLPVDTDPLPSTFQTPSPRPTAPKTPQQEFLLLPNEDLVTSKSFTYQWGKALEETVHWNIVPDNESIIDWRVPDFENNMATDQIDFDDDTKLDDIFFKHIFPSIEGHSKKLDKYFADPKAEFYETVKHDKLKFHDEDAEDPDWKTRQAYTILIAAASEIENGFDNMWKRGKGMGWRDVTAHTLAGSCLKIHSRHSSPEHIYVGLKRSIGIKKSMTLPGMYFFLLSSSLIAVEGSS